MEFNLDSILGTVRDSESLLPGKASKRRRNASRTKRTRRGGARGGYVRQEYLSVEKQAERRLQWLQEERTIIGMYKMMKRSLAQRRRIKVSKDKDPTPWEFPITREEWVMLWLKAGGVTLGDGSSIPAWSLRGKSQKKDVHLMRINDRMDWRLDNLLVVFKGSILADGRKVRLLMGDS